MGLFTALAPPLVSLAETAYGYSRSSGEAQKNRDFQERMSNTSHQREVEDLYKAGLNPILSARYGGSSTPSGSVAAPVHSQIGATTAQSLQLRSNLELQSAQARDLNSAAALKELDARQRESAESFFGTNEVWQKLRQLENDSNLSDSKRDEVEMAISKLKAEIQAIGIHSAKEFSELPEASKKAEFWKSWGGTLAPWLKEIIHPFFQGINVRTHKTDRSRQWGDRYDDSGFKK